MISRHRTRLVIDDRPPDQDPRPHAIPTAVCLGGGEVGRLGVETMIAEGARVLLVDPDETCMARSLCQGSVETPGQFLDQEGVGATYLKGEGVGTLSDILRTWTPDHVVPAMPGHLAARLAISWSDWFYRSISPFGAPLLRIMEGLPAGSVRSVDSIEGVMVISHMSPALSCKEGCDQPPVCPVTGNAIEPLYDCLDRALAGLVDHRSILVAHGNLVGSLPGYTLRGMLDLLDAMGEEETVAIVTSCRCHAILNILR